MTPTVWVGPTKCDSKRDRRTRVVENIWRRVSWGIGLHLDLGNAVDFFREALSCYQNGAFMATASMCRTCTETAVYLAISRERSGRTIETSLDSIHDRWSSIVRKARKAGFIDGETNAMLKHVRKKGNFAAHYSQKFDQKIAQRQGLGKLWIGNNEAKELLTQSAKILEKVYQKKNPSLHSEPFFIG